MWERRKRLKSDPEIAEYKEVIMWTAELTIRHAIVGTFSDDNFKNASFQMILEVISLTASVR
jgi:hypothetical protein